MRSVTDFCKLYYCSWHFNCDCGLCGSRNFLTNINTGKGLKYEWKFLYMQAPRDIHKNLGAGEYVHMEGASD